MKKIKPQFREEIYIILCRDWDPIGIYKDESDWDEEYQSYIPAVYKYLMKSDDPKKIEDFLENITKTAMGIRPRLGNGRAKRAALALVQKKKDFYG